MTASPDVDRATGLERVRRRADGKIPMSAVHQTFDLRLTDVEPGTTRAVCAVPPWLVLDGRIRPGLAAVVADAALGNAHLTTMPPGRASVTRELRLDHFAPMLAPPFEISAVGHVEDATGPMPLITGEISSGGVRVATASARCLSVPGSGELEPGAPLGEPVDAPSLDALIGARIERSLEGVRIVCTAPVAFTNVYGALHGGTVVLLAEQGLDAALAVVGLDHAVLAGLQVTYLRPVPADGSTVMVDAAVGQLSKRIVDVEAELTVAAGVAATVRATYTRERP